MRTVLGWVAVLAVASASLAACSSSAGSNTGVVEVVAAENFWGDIAAQIGAAHVHVTSIISDPNADPHEYESSTRNAAQVARAAVVIQNGLGYDDFMAKLLSVSAPKRRHVLRVDQVLSISGDNPNPHLWYDTAALPRLADAIAAALAEADPADAATFRANARSFAQSLSPLLGVIAQIRSRFAGTPIAYTERVPGYLVQAAGLRIGVPAAFAQAVEDGNEPSAADTAAFDAALRGRSVKVLLFNSQVSDATTDKITSLAASSGVPVVGVSETMPAADKNFQAWQLRQAQALLAALATT